MRRLLLLLILTICNAVGISSLSAAIKKDTFTYNPANNLKITRVTDSDALSRTSANPCIIFAFGGGFTHGDRDDARYDDYLSFMARQGYVVCSIDYSTTLGSFTPTESGTAALGEFGEALVEAVETATEDFLTATGFVLAKAREWNVSPDAIIASGSSAGAITALQAESVIQSPCCPEDLPRSFNYAAVVSFAGAILSEGEPSNLDAFCPVMLFHGDADSQVPYNKLTAGPMGLYGSLYLAERFKSAGKEGAFHMEKGATHEMALRPMKENLFDIAGFLSQVLSSRTSDYEWTVVTVPGRSSYKTDFTIYDYIRSNLP